MGKRASTKVGRNACVCAAHQILRLLIMPSTPAASDQSSDVSMLEPTELGGRFEIVGAKHCLEMVESKLCLFLVKTILNLMSGIILHY
jgi:hypothetical protein